MNKIIFLIHKIYIVRFISIKRIFHRWKHNRKCHWETCLLLTAFNICCHLYGEAIPNYSKVLNYYIIAYTYSNISYICRLCNLNVNELNSIDNLKVVFPYTVTCEVNTFWHTTIKSKEGQYKTVSRPRVGSNHQPFG